MKKYAVIDFTMGDDFTNIYGTIEDALANAEYDWNHLSAHDRNRRIEFSVAEFELNDEEEDDEYESVWNNFENYVKIFKKND